MADKSQEIRTKIVFEAQKAIDDMNEIAAAIDKVAKVDLTKVTSAFEAMSQSMKETAQSAKTVADSLVQQKQRETNATKKANQEQAQAERQAAREAQQAARQKAQAQRQYQQLLNQTVKLLRDIERHKGFDGMSFSLRGFNNTFDKINEISSKFREFGRNDLASLVNPGLLDGVNKRFTSLSSRIATAKNKAQELFVQFQRTKSEADRINFEKARQSFKQLQYEAKKFNDSIRLVNRSALSLENILKRSKESFNWRIGGAIENTLVDLPFDVIENVTKYELAMAGVMQVLPKLEEGQHAVNEEFKKFSQIGANYGQSVENVMDAARSIGRMYGQGDGDPDKGARNTEILTMQAAKMATVDNFDMTAATQGLESALAQFNLQTDNSNLLMARSSHILDVWTKLAHNGGASAQDLVEGVKQAGAAADGAGVSFSLLNALIATGVRATAKSGNEIGTTLKSFFASLTQKKSIEALERFGISAYTTGDDGTKHFRDIQDIIMDISKFLNDNEYDVKSLNEFAMAISGGKYQFSKVQAILKNYKELQRTLELTGEAAGFTNEQLSFQMDTVSRKLETLKANIANLFMENGNNGLTNDLKWLLNVLNDFIKGATLDGSNIYNFTKGLIFLGAVLKGLPPLFNVLSRAIGRYQARVAMGIFNSNSPNPADRALSSLDAQRIAARDTYTEKRNGENKAREQAQTGVKDISASASAKLASAIESETAALSRQNAVLDTNTTKHTQNAGAVNANGTKRAGAAAGAVAGAADATNTAQKDLNTKAHIENAGATNLNNTSTSSESQIKNAESAAEARNTAEKQANTGATTVNTGANNANAGSVQRVSSSLGYVDSMFARHNAELRTAIAETNASTAANNANAGSLSRMGAAGQASTSFFAPWFARQREFARRAEASAAALSNASIQMRAFGKATSITTSVMNAGRGAWVAWTGLIAAMGGPLGAITLALTVGSLAYSIYTEKQGEAARAAEELKQKEEEKAAAMLQAYDAIDKNIERCKNLAEEYNNLKKSLDEHTIAQDKVAEATERMGTIDKTIQAILNENTEQFKENGYIKIQTIEDFLKKQKEQMLQSAKKNVQEKAEVLSQIEGQIKHTEIAIQGNQERIKNIKKEIEAQHALSDAIKETMMTEARELRERAQHIRDSYKNRKGLIKHRGKAMGRANEYDRKAQAIEDALNAGMTKEGWDELAERAQPLYENDAELKKKLNGLENQKVEAQKDLAKAQEDYEAYKSDIDDTGGQNGDQTNYAPEKGKGGSDGSSSGSKGKEKKEQWTYGDESTKAMSAVLRELKSYSIEGGLGASMGGLMSLANALSGRNSTTWDDIPDLFKNGGKNAFDSALTLANNIHEGVNNGKTVEAVLEDLYPDIADYLRNNFENDTQYLNNKYNFTKYDQPFAKADPYDVGARQGTANTGNATVDKIISAADQYGVDRELALKLAQGESHLDQSQVSSKGAIGVMQLMPKTAEGLGVNPYDESENILGGMRYFSDLLRKLGGDENAALYAYNAGEAGYRAGEYDSSYAPYILGQDVSEYLNNAVQTAVSNAYDVPDEYNFHGFDTRFWDFSEYLHPENFDKLDEIPQEFKDIRNQMANNYAYLMKQLYGVDNAKITLWEANGGTGHATGEGSHYAGAKDDISTATNEAVLKLSAEAEGIAAAFENDHYDLSYSVGGDGRYVPGNSYGVTDYNTGERAHDIWLRRREAQANGGAQPVGEGQSRWNHLNGTFSDWNFNKITEQIYQAQTTQKIYEQTKKRLENEEKLSGMTAELAQKMKENEESAVNAAKFISERWQELYNNSRSSLSNYINSHGDINRRLQNVGLSVDSYLSLSSESMNEFANATKDKKFQEAVQNFIKAKEQFTNAFSDYDDKSTNYKKNYLGLMTPEEDENWRIGRIEAEYGIESAGKTEYQKWGIDQEYYKALNDIYTERLERQKADYDIAIENLQQQIDQLRGERAQKADTVNRLEARQANGEDVTAELDKAKASLQEIDSDLTNLIAHGDDATQKALVGIEATRSKLAELKASMGQVEIELENKLEQGFTNLFQNVLLEGKSFSDSWKDLWKGIGQYAWQMLMQTAFSKMGEGGGILGWLGRIFGGGKAKGGEVEGKATGGLIGYAHGGNTEGLIKGAGTGTSDSVLTYLQHRGQFIRTSNGEYIIKKSSVDKLGVPFLDMLNDNPEIATAVKRYANGGALGEEYVPTMKQSTVDSYKNFNKNQAEIMMMNSNKNLEALMQQQNELIGKRDDDSGNGGGLVVLNTHASSDDVMRAIQKNPRAIQTILGNQRRHGFR